MPLSMTTVIGKMAALMRETVPSMTVYSPTEPGGGGLPEAVLATPATLVMPGATLEYVQYAGQGQRHDYNVAAIVMASPVGMISAVSIAAAMGYVETLIDKFAENVRLTWDPDELEGVNAYVRFARQDGLQRLEWSGSEFFGWVVTFYVREDATKEYKVGG
jgi:hypothetical protein